jgi:hypothetical protein
VAERAVWVDKMESGSKRNGRRLHNVVIVGFE